MDHLKTSDERRDRWYSKSIRPKYVPIVQADNLSDHLQADGECDVVQGLRWPKEAQEQKDAHQELRSTMDEHGFVVIVDVMSDRECKSSLDLIWDYLLAASSTEHFLKNQTYPEPRLTKDNLTADQFPTTLEGGILSSFGSGHSSAAWSVRSHPNVVSIFQSFWNCDDVVSSLDGLVAWPRGYQSDAGWFHVDQNPMTKPLFCSVQGIVNLMPTTPQVGGNVLVAQSHKTFPQCYTENAKDEFFYKERLKEIGNDDWLEIDPLDSQTLDPDRVISCLLPAGSMLLWDSRVAHCSYPGTTAIQDQEYLGLIRACTLVSMMPAHRLSKETIDSRLEAIRSGQTLTHWADKVAYLGDEKPKENSERVKSMRIIREFAPSVIMSYDQLNRFQQDLVHGKNSKVTN